MGNKVFLKQEETGLVKKSKVGFSWSNLLLGSFDAFFRKDFKMGFIQIAVNLLAGIVVPFIGVFIARIVWAFTYNKTYIENLLQGGYAPASEDDKAILVGKGIIAG